MKTSTIALNMDGGSYQSSNPRCISLQPFTSGNLLVSRPRDFASAFVVLRRVQAGSGSKPFCRTVASRRIVWIETKDGLSRKFASRRQRKEFLAIFIVSGHNREPGKQERDADYILEEVGFFQHVGRPSIVCRMLLWLGAARVA